MLRTAMNTSIICFIHYRRKEDDKLANEYVTIHDPQDRAQEQMLLDVQEWFAAQNKGTVLNILQLPSTSLECFQ